MKRGDSILVQYPEDENPELWQERVVLVVGQNGNLICVTPDKEVIHLALEDMKVRVMGAGRRMPVGIRERSCYLVYEARKPNKFFTAEEVDQFAEEGEALASVLGWPVRSSAPFVCMNGAGAAAGGARRRLEAKSAVTALVAGTAARPAALPVGGPADQEATAAHRGAGGPAEAASTAPIPGDDIMVLEDQFWVCAEDGADIALWTQVPEPWAALRKGPRGLSEFSAGRFCLASLMTVAEASRRADELANGGSSTSRPVKEGSGDARVLEVKLGPRGRHRDFVDGVDACDEEDFDDFPLSGPRTTSWCLTFLRRRRTPSDHHAMFKTLSKLTAESWGMAEHENLMRLLELGLQYDQLDLTNMAWAEAALRRAQLIEWAHHERVREAEASGSGDRVSPEELSAFTGVSRAGESLMVAPRLLNHVKSAVETDGNIMKAVRKAREERELRRNSIRNKNKNKDT